MCPIDTVDKQQFLHGHCTMYKYFYDKKDNYHKAEIKVFIKTESER